MRTIHCLLQFPPPPSTAETLQFPRLVVIRGAVCGEALSFLQTLITICFPIRRLLNATN